MKPISPLTGTDRTRLRTEFDSDLIVRLYKDIDIPVSRFFQQIEKAELYECLTTGYRFYYPYELIGDAQFYEDLSISRPGYYPKRWEHSKVIDFIDRGDKVLEVGVGFGMFMDMLTEKGAVAKGLELNPLAVEKNRSRGLDVHNNLIGEEASKFPETYDVVCSFQVMEHITDVKNYLEDSIKTLKKGGKLIIGVPNNNPYLFIIDKHHTLNLPPHHAGLWNYKSLKNLEKIFPIKLQSVDYEPLEQTYDIFFNLHVRRIKSKRIQNYITRLDASRYGGYLRRLVCKLINGRNILVVFKKL